MSVCTCISCRAWGERFFGGLLPPKYKQHATHVAHNYSFCRTVLDTQFALPSAYAAQGSTQKSIQMKLIIRCVFAMNLHASCESIHAFLHRCVSWVRVHVRVMEPVSMPLCMPAFSHFVCMPAFSQDTHGEIEVFWPTYEGTFPTTPSSVIGLVRWVCVCVWVLRMCVCERE